MKKTMSVLIAIFMLVSIFTPFCFESASAATYTVNSAGFYKTVDGEEVQLEALEVGEFYAKASVTQEKNTRCYLMVGLYKGNQLYDVSFAASSKMRATSTVTISTKNKPITVAPLAGEDVTEYTAKIFVLEDLTNIMPLCKSLSASGFTKNDMYDNFSTVVCDTNSFEMDDSTSGRKFYESDNLIVYPNSVKAPYGQPKYEGHKGKVVTGTSVPSTAYASYGGDFADKYVSAVFSYPADSTIKNYGDLRDAFFKDNLNIYAGKTPDNMSPVEVTSWSGSTIDGIIYVFAKTNKLGADYKYVKIEIENFSDKYAVSSFRISDGTNGYLQRFFYDDYTTDDIYYLTDNMHIQEINRVTEYGTLRYCLQPNDGAKQAGVLYEGDFDGGTFTYLATMEDHFINSVLAPLHDQNYDRWGAWEDAMELADYNVFVGETEDELELLEPTSYDFKRPGQYRGFSVEVTYENLPANTKYIYIEVGNPYWSTRIAYAHCSQFIEGSDPNLEGYPDDYDYSTYAKNKVSVVTPAYTSDVSGDTEVIICAPNLTDVEVYSWLPEDQFGKDNKETTVKLNDYGLGKFIFPADKYPKGPIVVRIKGYKNGTMVDECHLQLYNKSGISWNQGLATAPVNKVVTDNNLEMVFEDDFNTMPTISWNALAGAKYSSHKIGYQDFSGLGFKDHDNNPETPFSQRDTYFRIKATQTGFDNDGDGIGSAGLIASMHQDRYHGFAVKAPAYFECRFIAQNVKGSWPAFWLMTTGERAEGPNGADELDIIEAYGFDYSQQKDVNGYHATMHDWGNTVDWDNRWNDHAVVDMANLNSGGQWYTDFHTYACYIGLDYTIYYCDNVEIYRHQTLPNSASLYHYWMFNYAHGGISGWPNDLTRYNNVSDMYVDWVRVYGLPQNVISNY